jgi:hypothetical protein
MNIFRTILHLSARNYKGSKPRYELPIQGQKRETTSKTKVRAHTPRGGTSVKPGSRAGAFAARAHGHGAPRKPSGRTS